MYILPLLHHTTYNDKKGKKIMDPNAQLLQDIYQNTVMGKVALNQLIKRCEDPDFRKAMADQFAEYHQVQTEAQRLLKATHLEPKRPPVFPLRVHTSLNLRLDRTSTHMAEMLMQGSVMGIVDLSRSLRKYSLAGSEARALGEQLLRTEENNLRRLQRYL